MARAEIDRAYAPLDQVAQDPAGRQALRDGWTQRLASLEQQGVGAETYRRVLAGCRASHAMRRGHVPDLAHEETARQACAAAFATGPAVLPHRAIGGGWRRLFGHPRSHPRD